MSAPQTIERMAAALADPAGGEGVRVVGARTKVQWGAQGERAREITTVGLTGVVEHNRGDFTAVIRAGTPLREAQEVFSEAGQTLAWDPPLGPGEAATVGGVAATGDSGPARHRYGGVRDTLLGITAVLSDGQVVKSGGKVIKNVAGYDLAKLLAGSYGTLGAIVQLSVRLHPAPERAVTVSGSALEIERLAAAAAALARLPLEAECLDLRVGGDGGTVLVRLAGIAAATRAREVAAELPLDDVTVEEDDAEIWERQRSLQRSTDGVVLKASTKPSDLPGLLAAVQVCKASAVCRAALGLSWVTFAAGADLGERVAQFLDAARPAGCVPLDGAEILGMGVSSPGGSGDRGGWRWPAPAAPALALMESVKRRFDPAGRLRPGVQLGGI